MVVSLVHYGGKSQQMVLLSRQCTFREKRDTYMYAVNEVCVSGSESLAIVRIASCRLLGKSFQPTESALIVGVIGVIEIEDVGRACWLPKMEACWAILVN